MEKGYELKGDVIILNRELTELDLFVRDFISVIKNYSDYLIVSGYVSISTGRIRGTEDVDILIEVGSEENFKKIFLALQKAGFWCYQGEDYKELYRYFKRKENLRFAKNDTIFPNMEVIAVTKERKAKYYEFKNPQKIKISDFEFKIPPIEFEIIYKEKILGSKKDREDAAHLRTFFSEILDKKKFKEIEGVIKDEI